MGSAKCTCTTACVHNCLCACSCARSGGVSSPSSPHIPVLLPPAHPDAPAASTALAAHVGLSEPARPFPCPSPFSPPPPFFYPHRPLGLTAGVQLLELLAKHLHLSTASFINIR